MVSSAADAICATPAPSIAAMDMAARVFSLKFMCYLLNDE
jgi:hypothetical protein